MIISKIPLNHTSKFPKFHVFHHNRFSTGLIHSTEPGSDTTVGFRAAENTGNTEPNNNKI